MGDRREEPFIIALGDLRRRLRRGDFPVDSRLAAAELAVALGLSATPVREALSRLAGEGLLEDRRGLGFFVRRLSRRDVAALYRLHLAQLVLTLEDAEPAAELIAVEGRDDAASCELDPVAATERLFARWVESLAPRPLGLAYLRIADQLAPVRRLEPQVFADLVGEAEGLRSAAPAERLARLRAFHQRRVRAADRLADLLERAAGGARR